jgi:putative DNA primase/helicase
VTVPEAAARWQSMGVAVVPIVFRNRPVVRWKQYMTQAPTAEQVHDWWGNGRPYGIAIICGAVSGGLEMTEIEARALSRESLTDIANRADELGCGDAWDVISNGYTQSSPSGGLHMAYRISDHEVPGNEKIAREAPSLDEASGKMVRLVRVETRGEGGYFVGAPSPGSCHPSGEPWLLASGEYGVVPSISWEQRNLIHEALRLALDDDPSPTESTRSTALSLTDSRDTTRPAVSGTVQAVAPAAPPASPGPVGTPGATSLSLMPGTDWAAQTDWADILEPNGWTFSHRGAGNERFWTRPGKDRGEGHSASTDYEGKPGLYVWSTSTGLPDMKLDKAFSKLFIHAHYSFNGDMSACAKHLRRMGYGDQQILDLTHGEIEGTVDGEPVKKTWFSFDDLGNGMRLQNWAKNFRYVQNTKQVEVFQDGQWIEDRTFALTREWAKLTEEMMETARVTGDEALMKWARKSRDMPRINAAIASWKTIAGVAISVADMDNRPDLVNLANGEYNTETKELEPHVPEHYMTRMMGAKHDPEAIAPNWTKFLEQVLPDEDVRRYVQRAVGYSLLGSADERAFFIIHGPSGTGKSQFLSTLEHAFGSYATTAAEGTFRLNREGGNGPTNDLNDLRGKRLVTTSETAEGTSFNESLMKRLTGQDSITSRGLYQENVKWTPECAIWLATNYPPRFNSDDDAIWKRAKLVPFMTRFGTDAPAVAGYARKFLFAEADGILNWIIEGLHDYQENGLGEPEAVQASAVEHREQSDAVIRFLDDMINDGMVGLDSDMQISTRELYQLYDDWSKSAGEPKLGSRRFKHRVESSGRASYARVQSGSVFKGLYRNKVMAYIPQQIGS